ncbi:drug/metabolite transporter (DMT)-like permease [Acidovorax soli]|uniref:Drug/metabolite transporter (DMT)-like permease n=1 Tax=Acidovorax soli TaxID=592050 RepID=A0A7X0PAA1_9BURK|nr:DMT family transporter [Acidovorax soli]MBB6558200.1 drug/metabolite transporter (DMT)-like permease [Acidovorax soli]
MRFSPRATGLLAALVTVTIWTSFIVIARASAQRSLAPLDISLLRIVGASLVLLPWGWWLVRRRRAQMGASAPASSLGGVSPLPLSTTALLGIFGGVLYAVLAYAGFFHAPATHAAVLMPGSLPLWTALLAVVVLRDRITPLRALGLALIVAGDLLVGGRSLLAGFAGGDVWKGDLLFMLAAACWASYSVQARRLAVDAVQATIAITAFALLVYVPVWGVLVALGTVTSHLRQAPWSEILFQLVFQGGGSVVVSGIAFTRMIQHYGPVRSTMITALVPGLSAVGAVLFLGEPMHWNLGAGLALVTTGILLGVLRQSPAPAPLPAAPGNSAA